jgi:predicted glycosyltransferase
MRILCHCQNLYGVGHFVRMHQIAVGLARDHDVYLVDGGRPVPRRRAPAEPRRIALPPLRRDAAGSIIAMDGPSAGRALARRARLLEEAASTIRPDVVIVEHYPFSKWELAAEIDALITTARRVNPMVRILCSVRDLVAQGHFDVVTDRYTERVLELLDRQFDALLVHSDPAFASLEDLFAGAASIPIPVHYTGYVVEPVAAPPHDAVAPWATASGGGTATTPYLAAVVEAFACVSRTGAVGETTLHVFQGPGAGARDADALTRAAAGAPVRIHRFSTEYAAWLQGAEFSVSHAGYNTTAALLRARVPAVVIRLAAFGLATVVHAVDAPDPSALAGAIARLRGAPRPSHHFDLDGVAATRRLVEDGFGGQTSTP